MIRWLRVRLRYLCLSIALLASGLAWAQAPRPATNVQVNAALSGGTTCGVSVTCWYVRPNGGTYGSENGTSWANAYDGFSDINWAADVDAGDVVCVAGGTYTQNLSIGDSGTSGNPITIRRAYASAADCGSGTAGWSSSFDSLISQTDVTILLNSNDFITISGKPSSNPTLWNEYGWKLSFTQTPGNGIEDPGTATNVRFDHMEIQGPDCRGSCLDATRGFDITPFSTGASNWVLSHMSIHGWPTPVYLGGADNFTLEYSDLYDVFGSGSDHPQFLYICDADIGVLRHNRFRNSEPSGTGIAFSDAGSPQFCHWLNWQIYSNLCFGNDVGGGGTCIDSQEAAISGLKVYNNTFWSNGTNCTFEMGSTGSESKNNLIFGTGGSCTLNTNANNVTASSNPFVNSGASNLHIISTIAANFPRNAGGNLGSTWQIDIDGCTRGNDGTWDAGAYEYQATPGTCGP